jgi:hypothetical protein
MKFRVGMPAGRDAPFRKALAFSCSVLIHGGLICILVVASLLGPPATIAVNNLLTPEEMKRVVWFDLRHDLPLIAPDWQPRTPETQKGTSRQAISAKPKNPQNADQFVKLPTIAKLAQVDVPAPDLIKITLPAAPERPKPKAFQVPAAQPQSTVAPAIMDVPQAAQPVPKPADTSNLLKTVLTAARPKPKPFQPPPPVQPKADGTGASFEPPPLSTQAPLPASGAIEALIVNKYPANTLPRLPEGSRRATVETGTPQGAGTRTVTAAGGTGMVVPDLSVSGGQGSGRVPNNGLVAEVRNAPAPAPEPPAPKFRRVSLPRIQAGVSVAYWPGARTLAPAVEERFRNRVAYVTVLEAPPGYATLDWVMWFAETAAANPGLRPVMRPPTMVSAAVPIGGPVALTDKLPVRGFLRITGHIDSLRIADPNADSPAARSYLEAIGESIFTAAVRNGEPVDVEVLLQISPMVVRKPLTAGQ